jgi:hypothetical protein
MPRTRFRVGTVLREVKLKVPGIDQKSARISRSADAKLTEFMH